MALTIRVQKNGRLKVTVSEGAEGITLADMEDVKDELAQRARLLQRRLENSDGGGMDGSGMDWADIYGNAKLIGELGAIVRRFCRQWEFGDL